MSTARQLANVLADLLRRERDALAAFLSALADFDRKGAWVELGHASLFAFLVKDLGLSNGAAAYRKAAVDLVQRFPQVLEPIRDGRLCVTTVFELSKVITDENAAGVLPRFFGASRRDAQNIVAELAARPAPARTVVTALAVPSPPVADLHDPSGRLSDQVRASSEAATQPGPKLQLAPRTVVDPRTAELSRVHLTVPRRLLQKLAAARGALSHSHFDASDAEVLEVGLDLVIERHRKRRGIGAKPRAKKASPPGTPDAPPPAPGKRSRHVPADVSRIVWERDRWCCAFPLESGGVCGSTSQIEIDHIQGWALGAGMTPEELRLACKFHQDVHARRLYGDPVMDRYTKPKGPPRCSEPVLAYGPGAARVAAGASPSAAARSPPRPRRTRTGPRSGTSRRTCRTSPRSPRSAC